MCMHVHMCVWLGTPLQSTDYAKIYKYWKICIGCPADDSLLGYILRRKENPPNIVTPTAQKGKKKDLNHDVIISCVIAPRAGLPPGRFWVNAWVMCARDESFTVVKQNSGLQPNSHTNKNVKMAMSRKGNVGGWVTVYHEFFSAKTARSVIKNITSIYFVSNGRFLVYENPFHILYYRPV